MIRRIQDQLEGGIEHPGDTVEHQGGTGIAGYREAWQSGLSEASTHVRDLAAGRMSTACLASVVRLIVRC
jgi:hypothetical protein